MGFAVHMRPVCRDGKGDTMRYDICILSDERDFAQMLALELRRDGRRVCVCADPSSLPEAEICLQDADRFPAIRPACRVLRYGRGEGEGTEEFLARPFRLDALEGLLLRTRKMRGLRMLPDGTDLLMDGERIHLTPGEHALLARLVAAEGKPVRRETLHAEVFGGKGDPGIVNVYMHYLRRKLERNGRRVICVMRGQGYILRTEEATP